IINLNILPLADSATTPAVGADLTSTITTIGMFAVIIVVFYFLLIRPQRKKEKDTQKMRSALQVGDEITTVGGVIGRIVTIKDDSIIIETGADRSKLRLKKWAIQSNDTIHDNG